MTRQNPTRVQIRANARRARAHRFYLRIRPDIRDWWDEFSNKEENGTCKYESLRSFAHSKAEIREQRRWIMHMFGPGPDSAGEVPWYGDWEKRRQLGFNLPVEPEKLLAMQYAIQGKLDSYQIVRASAPVCVKQFAKWARAEEQINKLFAGEIFLPGVAPEDPKQKLRWELWHSLMVHVDRANEATLKNLMRANGINPDNPALIGGATIIQMETAR